MFFINSLYYKYLYFLLTIKGANWLEQVRVVS